MEETALVGETILAEEPSAKETGRLVDVGEKIGGARKDLWADRGLRLADLEGMTGPEEAQYIVKANIWKPDYAAMVEKGAERKAVAMVKVMHDRLAAKPKRDTPEERRRYLQMMEFIRDAYDGVRTEEDVRRARVQLREERYHSAEDHGVWLSVYKGRSEPFRIGWSDDQRIRQLLAQGFPLLEPWMRRYELRGMADGTWRVYTRGRLSDLVGKHQTREAAVAAAREGYETAGGSPEKAPLPERPHLDRLTRVGQDYRAGRDVTGEDFLAEFGMRGVEYGNWAAQDERQRLLNEAWDGLHDLARTLGIPARALSLNGTLALAFGARGTGRAKAHYEPWKLVINMTKLRGAGSLAHEWGHALDHYFGELERSDAYRGAPHQVSDVALESSFGAARRLGLLRPEMAAAWRGVLEALVTREQTPEEVAATVERALDRAKRGLARGEARLATLPEGREAAGLRKWLDDSGRPEVEACERRLQIARSGGMPSGRVESQFYGDSKKLSGKSGKAGYWARPTELLARALEAYVFDRIAGSGSQSDYLVHGVEADRFAVPPYAGNPYPSGPEREKLHAAFGKLFATMRTRETDRGVALYEVREADLVRPALLPDLIRQRFGELGTLTEEDGAFRIRFADGLGDLVIDVEGSIAYEPQTGEVAGPEQRSPGQIVAGRAQRIGADAFIRLRAAGADAVTHGHEELHALLALGRLRPKEIDGLWRQHGYRPGSYGTETEGLQAFRQAEERVAATVGRLIAERLAAESRNEPIEQPTWFERVWAFLKQAWECMRWPDAELAKLRIVSGEVYGHAPAAAAAPSRDSERPPMAQLATGLHIGQAGRELGR